MERVFFRDRLYKFFWVSKNWLLVRELPADTKEVSDIDPETVKAIDSVKRALRVKRMCLHQVFNEGPLWKASREDGDLMELCEQAYDAVMEATE